MAVSKAGLELAETQELSGDEGFAAFFTLHSKLEESV